MKQYCVEVTLQDNTGFQTTGTNDWRHAEEWAQYWNLRMKAGAVVGEQKIKAARVKLNCCNQDPGMCTC